MSFKDNYNKLKTMMLKTKTSDIDLDLDLAVKDITSYKNQSGSSGYVDLIKHLISAQSSSIGKTQNLFLPIGAGQSISFFGQQSRINRYDSYEAIVSNISYCYRALNVLTENIISPDDITKTSLLVNIGNLLNSDNKTEILTEQIKDIINKLKIEKNLSMIVKNTLKFGDFFCELADAKTVLTSSSMLLSEYNQYVSKNRENVINIKLEDKTLSIVIDYSLLNEKINEDDKVDKPKKINDINLLFYEPSQIIKLQTDLFPTCLGYLVFPKVLVKPQKTMQDQPVNDICASILKSLENKIPLLKDINDKSDLQGIISYMVSRSSSMTALNLKFVPPDNMQHFHIPSTKYTPYGESIFEASSYLSKVLISLETALAIQRLSRSTEKRKIMIEVGLPRDAKKLVENIKEQFRKRKISLDSMGSVDTIPSMISTFEDIYIPQKDGKPFVDISTFSEGNVDTRSKVDELKFIRDSIVASFGVPASFLNLEENLCLKSTTYIPLLNGFSLKLSEIIEHWEKGNHNLYVYSYDHKSGKIVPGKITWAGYTRRNTDIIRVHLDNNKYIDCTSDHPFMLRDGSYKEAKDLLVNESLMPLYKKNTITTTIRGISYEKIYQPGLEKNKWEFTYQSIAYHNQERKRGYVIHHEDYNPRNNHPDNLKLITKIEHRRIHSKTKNLKINKIVDDKCVICGKSFIRSYNINKTTCSIKCRQERKRLDGLKSWESRSDKYPERKIFCAICGDEIKNRFKNLTDKTYEKISKGCFSCDKEHCKKNIRGYSITTKKGTKLFCKISYDFCDVCGKTIIISPDKKTYKNVCGMNCSNKILADRGAYKKALKSRVKVSCSICGDEIYITNWYLKCIKDIICDFCKPRNNSPINHINLEQEYKPQLALNHKVTKVEVLEGLHDTGDITIENYHNFAVDAGIFVHNSNKAALGEENILFARTIVSHQKYLSEQTTELIYKVCKIIQPEESLTMMDNVKVLFSPPQSLQFERQARYIGDLSTMIRSLEELGIEKEWAIKKYLIGIDWNEIQQAKTEKEIDKSLSGSKEEEGAGSY